MHTYLKQLNYDEIIMKKHFLGIITSLMITSPTLAEVKLGNFGTLTGNAGVMSEYLWRGIPQNKNNMSPYIGADLALPKDIYVGVWAAEVDAQGTRANGTLKNTNKEIDYYFGVAPTFGDFGFDVGYIMYTYQGVGGSTFNSNFSEGYGKITYKPDKKPYTVKLSYFEQDDNKGTQDLKYNEITGTYDVGFASLAITHGDYKQNSQFWSLSAAKELVGVSFTLAYTDTRNHNTRSNNKERLTLQAHKSF